MKALAVDVDAIRGYCGAGLMHADAEVTLLFRPRRAAALAASGLKVRSAQGEFGAPMHTAGAIR